MSYRLISYSALILLLCGTKPLLGQTLNSSKRNRQVQLYVNIPAQRLDEALLQLGIQVGIRIEYTALTSHYESQAVNGKFLPIDALIRIVRSSGFEVTCSNGRLIVDKSEQSRMIARSYLLKRKLYLARKAGNISQDDSDRMNRNLELVVDEITKFAKKNAFIGSEQKAMFEKTCSRIDSALVMSEYFIPSQIIYAF